MVTVTVTHVGSDRMMDTNSSVSVLYFVPEAYHYMYMYIDVLDDWYIWTAQL